MYVFGHTHRCNVDCFQLSHLLLGVDVMWTLMNQLCDQHDLCVVLEVFIFDSTQGVML